MIELSNVNPIELAPGEVASFDRIILSANNCTCHRRNTGSIKMTSRGIYEVQFSGNITGATAAAPVQLAIALGGAPLLETTMISVPAAANDFNNVSTSTFIRNCCCDFDRLTVVNTGENPLTIGANANFSVKKVC